jgi:hypothetical protein
MSSPLYTAMFRGLSPFLNNFTETGRTSYTFIAADPRDYHDILDVVLDGIYQPLLGHREFLREGCRHLLPTHSADRARTFSGIVYNEMRLKPETDRQWLSRLAARAVDAGDFAQYRHAGSPQALPGLTFDDCQEFYRRWYHPHYMHSFSSGPVLEGVLDQLGAAHEHAAIWDRSAGLDDRGYRPLIGPTGTATPAWHVVRARFAGAWQGWRHALAVRREMEPTVGEGALVVGPQLSSTGHVDLLAGFRSGGADVADRAEAALELLRELVKDPGPAAHVAPAEVTAYRRREYATLPDQIQWGLELAGPRVRSIDPLRFAGPVGDGEADGSGEVMLLGVCAVQSGATSMPAWSAKRAAEDEQIWRRAPITSSAVCLPIWPLNERSLPSLPHAEHVADCVRFIRGNGPAVMYLHSRLPVEPHTVHLIGVTWTFVARRLGIPAEATAATGGVIVRPGVNGSCVADLLLFSQRPEHTAHALAELAASLGGTADEHAMREHLHMHVRRRSAALLSQPAEFARKAASGQLGLVGAAAELADGLSGLMLLRSVLESDKSVLESVRVIIEQWCAAPATILVTGDRVPAEVFLAAATIPGCLGGSLRPVTAFEPSLVSPAGFSEQYGVTCGAWSTRDIDISRLAAVLVLTEHLHHRYMHRHVRENRGAYAVGATFDPFAAIIAVWSQADPEPDRSLSFYHELFHLAAGDPLTPDDLATAQLMAVRAERRRRASTVWLAAMADLARGPGEPPATALINEISHVNDGSVRTTAAALTEAAYHDVAFT